MSSKMSNPGIAKTRHTMHQLVKNISILFVSPGFHCWADFKGRFSETSRDQDALPPPPPPKNMGQLFCLKGNPL